jgi:hypothetical protein
MFILRFPITADRAPYCMVREAICTFQKEKKLSTSAQGSKREITCPMEWEIKNHVLVLPWKGMKEYPRQATHLETTSDQK